MARARNIKHGFFTNDQLAEMPALGRLLFIGLWTIADREGRLEDRPKKIKAEVLPYDECNVDDLLAELQRKKFIVRYQVDGNAYIQIVNFAKHQDPHYKERASVIPAPEGWQSSGRTPAAVPETVRQQVFDRDGRKCKRCGDTENLSLDHIVPRSKGGSHDIDNLQTLCRKCNSAKNNRQAKADVDPTSDQSRAEVGSSEVVTSPLIPDSGFLIPEEKALSDSDKPKSDLTQKAKQVIDHLNEKTGCRYRHVEANLTLVKARLKEGFSVDDCLAVIDTKVREWSGNPDFEKYLRPETLFARGKFASYSGQSAATAVRDWQ